MTDHPAYGSRLLEEDDFVAAVEEGRYPNVGFHHADHLRLAWIYVRRYGPDQAEERMTATLRNFAAGLGHEAKYHETQTRAWLRLIAAAHHLTPGVTSFDGFLAQHEGLLDRSALSAFYSETLLAGNAARRAWIAPDLRPLPNVRGDNALPATRDPKPA